MNQFRNVLLVFMVLQCGYKLVAQGQLPGELTSEQAKTILKAAEQKASSQKILINIAIVDSGTNLKAFLRMDGSYLGSIDVAIKKAKTARYFNASTKDIGKMTQPGQDIYNIEHSNNGLITFPGGVPITDKNGNIIGAIGISGGTIEQDDEIAILAAKSIL